MDEFLQLRENKDLYEEFYRYFLKPVVGKANYVERIMDHATRKEKDVSTVSDEAFALLLMENCYDRCVDLFISNNFCAPSIQRGVRSNHERSKGSEVKTKYTSGGIFYKTKDDEGNLVRRPEANKGWSREGIQRFNELHTLVGKDRSNNHAFFKKFLKAERDLLGMSRKSGRRRSEDEATPIEPTNELFQDSDEEKEADEYDGETEGVDDEKGGSIAGHEEVHEGRLDDESMGSAE